MKIPHLAVVPAILLTITAITASSCHRAPRFGYDFEQEKSLDLIEWNCLTLFRTSPEHATSGTRSLEISFFPASESTLENYPGVSFSKFDSDWSGHRTLVFDVYNPESAPIRAGLRIDDRKNPDYAERYNRSLAISPGMNRVSIPFGELVTSGTKQPLNMRNILTVIFFVSNPVERHTLFVDRVGLE